MTSEDPELVESLLQANEQRRRSDFRAALDIYLYVIERFGQDASLFSLVAFCYYTIGFSQQGTDEDNLNAVKWVKRAIALEPSRASLYSDLGEYCALATLDYEQAAQAYRRAIELDPCSVRALLGASSLYGLPEGVVTLQEAMAWLERVTELEPNDPVWYVRLGRLYQEAGRPTDARKAAYRVLLCQQPLAQRDVEKVRSMGASATADQVS